MRLRYLQVAAVAAFATLLIGCAGVRTGGERAWNSNLAVFEEELRDLQGALAIPGLAYVIVEDGRVLGNGALGVERGEEGAPFAADTQLRIASVTKALTAVVALQLIEDGQLDLDTSVRLYAPGLALPDDVHVRHLLTHTSEGRIGAEYIYGTNRYAMLQDVIEATSRMPFDELVRQSILDRAGMEAYPSPALGAHAGLVSTTRDMGKFLVALDRGELLEPASLARLDVPSRSTTGEPLPVSLGWFSQTMHGERLVWSFGQDEPEHSGALLLRVPERNLSLFILANSNVLSDPFRLLMGDISKSPFAMSFLRLFVFSRPGQPLERPMRGASDIDSRVVSLEAAACYSWKDEMLGWGLIDLWNEDVAEGQRKFDFVRARYPHEADAVVHFAALRLPGALDKDQAIQDGEQLLVDHPANRWVLLVQGYLLQQRERTAEASRHFQTILDLTNQEPDFVHRLFQAWSWMALAQMSVKDEPEQARVYLNQLIASGIEGGMLDEAKRMLATLD